MTTVIVGQLDLLVPQHIAEPYQLERLWGLDRATDGSGWWAWRCTCGRDVGVERRCAYSDKSGAARMAWWHQRNTEPWANPYQAPGDMTRVRANTSRTFANTSRTFRRLA